jgi:uncharacterized delta-60 repeat protein
MSLGRFTRRLVAVASLVLAAATAAHAQAVDAFNPGANSQVYTMALQPDGKILVGGQFTGLGGGTGTTTRHYIGRLNADGTVDLSFDPGANSSVVGMALQPDGKIVVGGVFTGLGGGTGTTTRNRIGRLNADGTVDATFNPGANGIVYAIAPQPDGKIVVGGDFTGLGGGTGTTTRNRIGRLNADGTVDAGFTPGANNLVFSLALQADGRILVAGTFTGLGGGTGTTTRNYIGRLGADGTVDISFDPGATTGLNGIALQPDGKVLVGGAFTGLGGGTGTTARLRIGRLLNNIAATQSLTVTGTSVVTWSRAGASPELQWAQFAFSTDGLTYTDLGPGTRVAGGWQISGLSLPADPNLTIRARGFYAAGVYNGSGSIAELVAAPGTNLIQNGDFSGGTTNWAMFEQPDIQFNVTGGVFQYYRQNPTTTASGQAVVFQVTGQPVAANTPLRAQFDIGNSSAARKRITVLAIDSDFSDITVCTFWLAPGAPLRTYTMRTHTTKNWSNAALYFYAATKGQDGGFYQLDNVSLQNDPAVSTSSTDCGDPAVPAPPGGLPGADLMLNGDFEAGGLASWTQFGSMTWQVAGGVFEFIRPAPLPTPAGVIYQNTGQLMAANDILTATFQLGNSSAVRKRVTVLLQESDFSDLNACTFWLAPSQPLGDYTMRGFTTKPWTNATLAIYAASVGAQTWTRVDNVTFRRTPSTAIVGTECVEPPPSLFAGPAIAVSKAPALAPALEPLRNDGSGWLRTSGAGWQAVARGHGVDVLYWARPIDLTDAANARLTFRSALSRSGSIGEAQISADGITWQTIASVPDGSVWVSADLTPYLGQIVYVRFVFKTVAPDAGARPDEWSIEDISVESVNIPMYAHGSNLRVARDPAHVRGRRRRADGRAAGRAVAIR